MNIEGRFLLLANLKLFVANADGRIVTDFVEMQLQDLVLQTTDG